MNARPASPEELLAHDRYVRAIARSLLFEEHAVDDVVQQTWLSALRSSPRRGGSLRHWLGSIARNLSRDRLRRDRARVPHESAAAKPEAVPSPAEMLAFEQTRRRVVDAVLVLAEPYRTALWLRFFEDLPPRKIGDRMGVPAETARSWVRRGLDLVRAALDQQYSGRGAWCLALVPLAAAAPMLGIGAGAAAATKATYQTVTMASTQMKVGIAAAAVAAFVAALWTIERSGSGEPQRSPSSPARADGVAIAPPPGTAAIASVESRASDPSSRTAAADSKPADPAAKTNDPFGTVVVHFRWGDDKSPAAGVGVRVAPQDLDNSNFMSPLARTDSEGTVRFERILPGRAWLRVDRWFGESLEVKRGELVEITKDIPEGFAVQVLVVNASAAPVEGAEVYLNEQGLCEASVGATDKDGKLTIRSVGENMFYLVGSRAAGYSPSNQVQVLGKKGGNVPVTLKLPGPGGAVEGRVVDRDGSPVANATIVIGAHDRMQIPVDGGYGQAPDPTRTRTDDFGKFRVAGRPSGKNPVYARVAGFAPWTGSVEVPASGAAALEITLVPGVTLLGTVTGGDGKPVARAQARVGDWGAADEFTTFSKADGTYALRDLPVEPVTVRFERDKVGKASFAVRGNPGETIRFDAILSLGLRLVGRVVDETGAGVKGANVQASPMESAKVDANDSGGFEMADGEGRFEIANCKDVPHRMWITNGLTGDSKLLENVMPGRGELVITVPAMPKADCSILGTVVDSQRKPVASARVSPYRMGASFSPIELTDASGAFKVGNLTPGTYAVDVSGAGLASRRLPRHELKPGDSWDLGVIELPSGARLTVHYRLGPEVDPAAKPWFDLIDEAGPYGGGGFLPDDKNPTSSARLRGSVAAGTYMLQIQGASIAATQMPVTLVADRENVVDVVLGPGVMQQFRFEKPKNLKPGSAPPRATVRSAAGSVVHVFDLWGSEDKPAFESSLSFAPGEYSYQVVTDAGVAASGSFHVGTAPGEPVAAALK